MTEPRRSTGLQVRSWQWGPDDHRRPGLPWIGVFLLVFGLLLLLERFVPQFRLAGSGFLLAVGLVLLVRWAVERGIGSLYAGAIITGLAAPGLLEGLGIVSGGGLGMLCLGLAFLFIALVRSSSRGGLGWQAWFGGLLVVFGLTRLTLPAMGQLLLPAVLVVIGVVLVLGGLGSGRRWTR